MYNMVLFLFSTGMFPRGNAGPANARFMMCIAFARNMHLSVFQLNFVLAMCFDQNLERLRDLYGSVICDRILSLVRQCRSCPGGFKLWVSIAAIRYPLAASSVPSGGSKSHLTNMTAPIMILYWKISGVQVDSWT